ncbi:MAG: alkaline phosphatase family protein [Planctomycetota bacterium]
MRVAACLLIASLVRAEDPPAPKPIRLVLQITVDGLRGDMLGRDRAHLDKGGFRTLLTRGVVFANAQYRHANTETIVGHSTLATGSYPRDHGMISNLWFDRTTGHPAYNVEDGEYPLLRTREEAGKGKQLDPTQRAARTDGRSPRNIRGTTFSDELRSHTAGKAKVFAVSAKDRGAIPLAGHGGKAYWYSVASGDFVTSRYYVEAYPEWVKAWNAKRPALAFEGKTWELLDARKTYLFRERDDRPYERDIQGFGRTFPHPYGPASAPTYFTRLAVGPAGDELTASFATELLVREQLGQDDVPDYLAVSFSGVDFTNHFFGPSSLENEDHLRQLDRTLAKFLVAVDRHVGLDRTIIALCADHGMAEMPEAMAEAGLTAKRLYSDDVMQAARRAAHVKYGAKELVRRLIRPYVYLDEVVLEEQELDRDEVAAYLADQLTRIEGIARAVPRKVQAAVGGAGPLGRVQRNFNEERSGDIYLVQEPYWFFFERSPIGAMHGSPWRYDTFVPLIFVVPGVEARTVHRRVHPSDLAPTLSALLGTKQPAMARGTALVEVTSARR